MYVFVVVPKEDQLPQEELSALSLLCTSYPVMEFSVPAVAPLHDSLTFPPVELVAARDRLVGAPQEL